MSGAHTSTDFTRCMPAVAIELLGEPNKELSTRDEMRWGTRGSMCVDCRKGTWCDHEAGGAGGGVLDLLKLKKGLEKEGALAWLRERKHLTGDDAGRPRIVATYDYTDATGELIFQVCRFVPKDFRQRRPDGQGGWVWKTAGMKLCLYRIPELIEAVAAGRTIYVAEGEKAVDAVRGLGLPATCSPGGAGKWRAHYSPALTGANVVLLPDNDEPGRHHAAKVAAALKGFAKTVRMLALPGLPEKGDAYDWIAAGGTADDLLRLVSQADEADGAASAADVQADASAATNTDADAVAAVVAEFNERFMVVNEDGKAVILQPGFDPILKRRKYDRLSTRDLQTLYLNRLVKVGTTEEGAAVWKTAADVWLRHRERRQFICGVEFDPSATPKLGVLNLWEGFAVKPKPGNWTLLRDHMRDVMCAADPIRFNYLVRWIALMLQRPAQMGEVAVVLKGVEGCGKGTLARALMHIMGGHGLAISNAKHLVGNFNAHLASTVFLFADEAFFAGDRAHVAVLKALITEPQLAIEAKFANMRNQPNFLHLMMASNEEWVVPASLEARRFFVLDVPPDRVGDFDYFAAIWKQMEAGGYAAMLHDMLQMDLITFNVRAVPTTDGLQQQRKLSLPTTEAWWLDCLERGYVFKSKLGLETEFAKWHATISTELLFASYAEFAQRSGERRPLTREGLGRFFVKVGAKATRWRNGVTGEAITDEPTAFGSTRRAKLVRRDMPTGYSFGPLAQARAEFSNAMRLAVQWDDGISDDESSAGFPVAEIG